MCGRWHTPFAGKPYPHFLITQHQWALWTRYCDGERDLVYEEGRLRGQRFEPGHVKNNVLKQKHVKDMLAGVRKYYYTGSPFGKTLFMVDEDAHEDWQTDLDALHQDMLEVFGPDGFFVTSTGGNNYHFKLDFAGHSWKQVNELLGRLDQLVKRLAQQRGRQCVPEIKGKPSADRQHYGTLAKLPCFGHWSEERLEEFLRLPVKSFAWLTGVVEKLEAKVQPAPEPKPAPAPKAAPEPEDKPRRVRSGSCLGIPVTEDELARLPDAVKWYKNQGLTSRLYDRTCRQLFLATEHSLWCSAVTVVKPNPHTGPACAAGIIATSVT